MFVRYKRNKKSACYDSNNIVSGGRPDTPQRPHEPFTSCGDCPYAAHGFMCYSTEGNCMKTDLQRLNRRRKDTLENQEMEVQKP